MRMERKKLRIGDLAEMLEVKRFVIRFWEKEFNLKSLRSDGGQRHYDNQDYQRFALIKKLLYQDRLTIEGAKKILSEQFAKDVNNNLKMHTSPKINIYTIDNLEDNINNNKAGCYMLELKDIQESNKILSKLELMPLDKLIELQKKLIKLRESL